MDYLHVDGHEINIISVNTVVVGAGAAALNAADKLHAFGIYDLAIICEDLAASTSRNAGSDKQTYYKLSLSGGEGDSVREMAQTLMDGQCVDGDIALAEAANSAACFLRLCELGVPFPVNRYGEYVGYKTDHDPRKRATSAGPLTSKLMVEALERSILAKDINVFSGMLAVSILTRDKKTAGVLCLDLNRLSLGEVRYAVFNCVNIVWATGGPAGIYADTVYPVSQHGATGIALEAGARGRNLTEWQYGLASLSPRWNVSGTYMQVLPRFISTDSSGGDEREFLDGFFDNRNAMLDSVFLKGYQWPFDVRKASGGSSLIDILVYVERCVKGRRVFLDFRRNIGGGEMDCNALGEEARNYLNKAGALFGTPIDRLIYMNAPAYEFYLSYGVDLKHETLEIALCAQHNNGGLAVDCWWQTNVKGLFAVGEVAGCHGVYRPGGSALNAGQVGSMRAVRYIAAQRGGKADSAESLAAQTIQQVSRVMTMGHHALTREDNIMRLLDDAQRFMSRRGASVRDSAGIKALISQTKTRMKQLEYSAGCSVKTLAQFYRYRDTLITQFVYLSAMADYINKGGKSRGSALYHDSSGNKPHIALDEMFRCRLDDADLGKMVQEVEYKDGECVFEWRPVNPLPLDIDVFENIWRDFRENGSVY
jgi:succinate dehydrogenase / fumarate reductase, flavoprotein subunit